MLTPVDIANRVYKGGIGYDKKDVDAFMSELSSDYKELYSSNIELKDKIATLNESLQHYRSIEDSMQKALTLSEKTAEETVNAANNKARQITNEAELKAEAILVNAKLELQSTKDEIYLLQQQFNTYKQQFSKILDMQKKLMDSEMIGINLGDNYEPSAEVYGGYFGSFGNDSGLGGLGSGTYVGSNDNSGRERANQEPAFDRGSSLNMDPFADAANGGGRFSRQTGGAYTGAKKNVNKSGTSEGLNMKDANYNKVKRPVAANAINPAVKPEASSNNITEEKQPESTNTTQTVTKDDVLEAINAVKQVVEQQTTNAAKKDSVKETTKNTAYVLYTEEEATKESETLAKSEITPKAEPLTESNVSTKAESLTESNVTPITEPLAKSNVSTNSESPVVENAEDTLTGDVENKISESHMLDSDDNHEDGFDFIEDDIGKNTLNNNIEAEEETYSGEVEDKVNESHMLDSEDNHGGDEFDFIVDDSAEEEIPTIFTATASMNSFNTNDINVTNHSNTNNDVNADSNIDSDNDVLVGDVEDKTKSSNLIGNSDDDNEGFNFI